MIDQLISNELVLHSLQTHGSFNYHEFVFKTLESINTQGLCESVS